jgi:hypothetical protein
LQRNIPLSRAAQLPPFFEFLDRIVEVPDANDSRWTKAQLRANVLQYLKLADRIERG